MRQMPFSQGGLRPLNPPLLPLSRESRTPFSQQHRPSDLPSNLYDYFGRPSFNTTDEAMADPPSAKLPISFREAQAKQRFKSQPRKRTEVSPPRSQLINVNQTFQIVQQINNTYKGQEVDRETSEEAKWNKIVAFMKKNPKVLMQMMNMMEREENAGFFGKR